MNVRHHRSFLILSTLSRRRNELVRNFRNVNVRHVNSGVHTNVRRQRKDRNKTVNFKRRTMCALGLVGSLNRTGVTMNDRMTANVTTIRTFPLHRGLSYFLFRGTSNNIRISIMTSNRPINVKLGPKPNRKLILGCLGH